MAGEEAVAQAVTLNNLSLIVIEVKCSINCDIELRSYCPALHHSVYNQNFTEESQASRIHQMDLTCRSTSEYLYHLLFLLAAQC